MSGPVFSPADILLPKSAPMEEWAVVACDQFSSQPEYWKGVAALAAGRPSAFHFIFPECWLETGDPRQYIRKIHEAMESALEEGVFREVAGRFVYLERTLAGGRVRRGLIGALDLEAYSYRPGDKARVRATEGTVEERLPPRMDVRREAPLELPHVMVLIDDRDRTVIEPLGAETAAMTPEYSGPLMEGGGSVRGWSLSQSQAAAVQSALARLEEDAPMTFAVGDGNHSLAAAKECYEELKQTFSRDVWEKHPARYALVELVNLYDDSLVFEPIHRLVCCADPAALMAAMKQELGLSAKETGGQPLVAVAPDGEERLWIENPSSHLTVGSLQNFLDRYTAAHRGVTVDYIHGEEDLRQLVAAGNGAALGFLLPPMPKEDLFPSVVADGVLPRKTFSMGEARDKRYYLECRRIR